MFFIYFLSIVNATVPKYSNKLFNLYTKIKYTEDYGLP